MTAAIHQAHKSSYHSKLHNVCCSKSTQHCESPQGNQRLW